MVIFAPGGTPNRGNHLPRWKWGVVKVGWVVKWHLEMESRRFWCKDQYKNGFGEWSFLHPRGTPDRGNHLPRWKWGVVKVWWVVKWHLVMESRWFWCKNQYKNGFGKWSCLHPGGTPDRGNHLPRWKWGVVKVGRVVKWHLEIESRWFWYKNQYKNGFGKWSFLHPGGTPDRGNHLSRWKWGVVKVGWVVKWHLEIESGWFSYKNQCKNGFGKWSFLHPGGTPDRGNHLPRWKWGVVKVGWVVIWPLDTGYCWFWWKNQCKNGFGKWSFLHLGGTRDRGNHRWPLHYSWLSLSQNGANFS